MGLGVEESKHPVAVPDGYHQAELPLKSSSRPMKEAGGQHRRKPDVDHAKSEFFSRVAPSLSKSYIIRQHLSKDLDHRGRGTRNYSGTKN
ncbi:UNVERIFIED_CONTAM: hypothetical protein PYX00_000850 [Menopon gallinae]|uniref:Uncharacterized protein n=1 Tax=Menopon gallinae TaxID=328185 RepID=A0AAW2IBG7_9NEOP